MAQQNFVVSDRIPAPARNLLLLLQSTLKLPKSQCQQIIQEGGVRVNGKSRTKSHQQLECGDRVEVQWLPQPVQLRSQGKKATSLETFSVVYDDQDLLVVHKPANLLTVPTPHRESRTLISLVTAHLKRTATGEQAYCVHRLDRGVSGLLVFAKSIEVAELIRDQFAARKPDRQYVAIVTGTWRKEQGTIRTHLATDDDLNRYSTTDTDKGELAITHYEVREQWSDASLLEVRLETGRRNQIRVHLAEAEHPVLGDPRYRPQQATHWAWPYRRIALHAESLGFQHPRTTEPLSFKSNWPKEFRDFQRLVKKQ
ncbi:MAG: RluA family pseudouridine synthase [Pirellulaceae bacterium]|nr:RluA family pseudouridine synthase [Pirellulaceae bacterium]